ncbi:FAD binding domain-containing protein [Pisolithus albus]|nr:FAD binding domain-containing protein [Pisolithus albus]
MRMVNKFGVGRVFVAGDAAHVHSPTGGQGLNAQDAFHLSWKLALVYKSLSPASLLDTYPVERLPVITETLGLTTEILKRIHGESKAEDARTAMTTRGWNRTWNA